MDLSEYFNNLLKENNLNIENIHKDTKISKKFLNSLKKGDYKNFPATVYVKGFLKELEKYFKLNNNELLSLFNELDVENNVEDDFKYEPLLNIDKNRQKSKLFIFVSIFIGLLIIFTFIVINKNKIANEKVKVIKKEKKSSKVIIPKIKIEAKKLPSENNTDVLIENISKKIDNITSKLKNTLPEDNKTYIISLKPSGKVWVRINADNKTHKTFFLETKTINLEAKNFIKVDIGNAANLKIFINKEEYPLNGKRGEVKHITINLKKLKK